MPGSTLAGIITAIGTVLTATALVINACAVWRRDKRIERKVDSAEHKIDGVHTIVNQQRTDMQRYIRAQSALLTANGIELPIDQSIDPDENNIQRS